MQWTAVPIAPIGCRIPKMLPERYLVHPTWVHAILPISCTYLGRICLALSLVLPALSSTETVLRDCSASGSTRCDILSPKKIVATYHRTCIVMYPAYCGWFCWD